jgi:hypothetical protein
MPAGRTYTPIATSTVTGSSTTTVTFSSIPATYTDLIIISNYIAAGNNYLMMRFNSDTGNNYSRTEILGTGSSVSNFNGSNEPYAYISSVYAPTGQIATFVSHIMNYANTTTFKSLISRGNNSTIGTSPVINMWRSTSAINTILLTPIGTGFNVGSTFTIYGIAAA